MDRIERMDPRHCPTAILFILLILLSCQFSDALPRHCEATTEP
jgi:hypothetical protein